MKISVACGGTGGHIFPGLATSRRLIQRGHPVVLWLVGKDVEAPALKDWEGPVVTVPSEGLPSGFSLRAIRTTWKMFRAFLACRKLMKKDRPDVLLAMGSYASAGPVSAALSLRVPVILHEANVLPGRAVALFSRWVRAVAASFEETRFYLKRKDLVLTGMPVRAELESRAREKPPVRKNRDIFTILVMGGSRGARRLNEVASRALADVHKAGHRIRVIHLTGFADEQAIKRIYVEAGVDHDVAGFVQDMSANYQQTDLAICRSGAATCAELALFNLPALLVPYPFAAHDHQTVNARALEKRGMADVVPERDLEAEWLGDYIVGCIRDPKRLARMSAAYAAQSARSAAEALADLVESVGGSGHVAHPSA